MNERFYRRRRFKINKERLSDSVCLPYYKIEKTQDGKEFFFSNVGYFNFWDTYLILRKDDIVGVYVVLVNRNNREFHGQMSDEQKINVRDSIADSVYLKKPKEMFEDFPEMKNFDYLKEYSICSLVE